MSAGWHKKTRLTSRQDSRVEMTIALSTESLFWRLQSRTATRADSGRMVTASAGYEWQQEHLMFQTEHGLSGLRHRSGDSVK